MCRSNVLLLLRCAGWDDRQRVRTSVPVSSWPSLRTVPLSWSKLKAEFARRLVRKLAFFFNAVVTIMGLITTILAIVGQISVVDACPAESECTNHVAVGVIILGGLLILIGVLGVFGTWKNIHFFMTGANFVHSLVAFLTLVSGLFIGILSGYMGERSNGRLGL